MKGTTCKSPTLNQHTGKRRKKALQYSESRSAVNIPLHHSVIRRVRILQRCS